MAESRDRELPPRGRQQLQRIRVLHGPADEDGRDAYAQEEAEQRATGGQEGDFGDGGTEGGDDDGQEAEEDAGVGHVDLVQRGHVA